MKALISTVVLLSTAAFAGLPERLNLPVGNTLTMSMPSTVSSVTVSNPSLVEISREGRRITLVGKAKGHADAVIRTTNGEHKVRIYVAQDRYSMP